MVAATRNYGIKPVTIELALSDIGFESQSLLTQPLCGYLLQRLHDIDNFLIRMDSLCPDYAVPVEPNIKFDLAANNSAAEIKGISPVVKM